MGGFQMLGSRSRATELRCIFEPKFFVHQFFLLLYPNIVVVFSFYLM